jgi:hypothetical protein
MGTTKRLLDLIPQFNEAATHNFSIPDLRNILVSAMGGRLYILSQEQGIPYALEDEKSEEFLEIICLYKTFLQQNRSSGDLEGQYHTLKYIAGMCFGPDTRLQPLALPQFLDCFYTAEAIDQRHIQACRQ